MRALTIRQPWAWYITEGRKRYETRSFNTKHRGLLAIHAGKYEKDMARAGLTELPLGAVVCTVQIVACHRTEDLQDISEEERSMGDFSPGRYAWELQDVEVFDQPVPARGNLGFWNWTPPND